MKDLFGQSGFGGQRGMDGLKIVSRCPLCQTEHNPLETAILDETDSSHLLYIKCQKCGSGVVAAITPGALGVTSVGVVTDLNGFEVKLAKDWGRVNADDVLDIVEYFKENDSL